MSNRYRFSGLAGALIGAMLLFVWRYLLRHKPQPVQLEEPEDYGTPVAPTG